MRKKYRRRRFFGTSFYRVIRRVRGSSKFRRRRSRYLWRIRKAMRRTRSRSVLPLFDNAEETVRLLRDKRAAVFKHFAASRTASSTRFIRAALASALLGRYLRERIVIDNARERKKSRRKKSRRNKSVRSKYKHSKHRSRISSSTLFSNSTNTASDLIGYQLRLNAVRRGDSRDVLILKKVRTQRRKYLLKNTGSLFYSKKRFSTLKRAFKWKSRIRKSQKERGVLIDIRSTRAAYNKYRS